MKERALSLDALRGSAILLMVLSGTMAMTHLPAWMAHAQVPPGLPFDPSIYGITWVDLVFPFFLFAMGAAFPFSIGAKLEKGVSKAKLSFDAIVRGLQLVYFAIFLQHVYPNVVSQPENTFSSLIALFSFVLMFAMFMPLPWALSQWIKLAVKWGAFLLGFLMIINIPYADRSFDLKFSNIIIIVLANMAVFGTLAYLFTCLKPAYRLAILPFVAAVFLSSTNDGWVKEFYNYTPFEWAYRFYYLKYLFIVIPGSIAGQYLRTWINTQSIETDYKSINIVGVSLLSLALIVLNVCLLYTRSLELNLFITISFLLLGYLLLRKAGTPIELLWQKLFYSGAYLLLLGLVLEAYEGGIRKDHSTYSYYFVCSGLACYALLFFNIVCDFFKNKKATTCLIECGQNPMIAYVGASLVVLPLLRLTGVYSYFTIFNLNAYMGVARGLIITALVCMLTMCFTRLKWFWRT